LFKAVSTIVSGVGSPYFSRIFFSN